MKSTQKGNQYEKEVKTILENQGWYVEGQHRKVMWIRDKITGQMKMIMAGRDIFGCDLIAKKRLHKSKWIQVSTVAQKSSKTKQVKEFSWNLEHEDVELWLRIDGKRAFRRFIAVPVASQEPDFEFAEVETEYLKGSKNDQESEDGDGRIEDQMASEYPE